MCRQLSVVRINPASAGKILHDQQVFLTTIQFSLNCGSYPSAASTAAATSKTTRPFSNVVGAAQLAETSQATGAVSASARSAPRRPRRNAQHIERYIPCPQPSALSPRPRRLCSRSKGHVNTRTRRDLGLVLF